jgi:death-on-curing protein
MKDPRFLTLEQVLALHADQVRRYGGSAGIRDLGLLQSALAMPRASFGGQYLHPSLHEMAAACLFHLVQNHPFIDGNKRIGLAATIAFLGLNEVWLESDPDELLEMVLNVARGEIGKPEIAVFLRERCIPFGR